MGASITKGFKVFSTCAVLLAVGAGCTPVVVGGATVVGSDKTVIDHVVSYASGKDCSAVRLERDEHYCKEDVPVVNPNIYCYQTLGTVTCYNRPDPFNNSQYKLGDNEHNMVKRTPQR